MELSMDGVVLHQTHASVSDDGTVSYAKPDPSSHIPSIGSHDSDSYFHAIPDQFRILFIFFGLYR